MSSSGDSFRAGQRCFENFSCKVVSNIELDKSAENVPPLPSLVNGRRRLMQAV
jgi:hypothetical protein